MCFKSSLHRAMWMYNNYISNQHEFRFESIGHTELCAPQVDWIWRDQNTFRYHQSIMVEIGLGCVKTLLTA